MQRRRLLVLLVLAAVAATASGCSTLNFIKRRMPPPTQSREGVTFQFYAPAAHIVQLMGNWPENNWGAGQAQTGSFLVGEMKDRGDGVWERTEPLAPGRYQYKFLINRVDWKEDPNNPNHTDDGYGGYNSLVDVRDLR